MTDQPTDDQTASHPTLELEARLSALDGTTRVALARDHGLRPVGTGSVLWRRDEPRVVALDGPLTTLASALDGSLTLDEIVSALAEVLVVDGGELRPADLDRTVRSSVRRLALEGFLEGYETPVSPRPSLHLHDTLTDWATLRLDYPDPADDAAELPAPDPAAAEPDDT